MDDETVNQLFALLPENENPEAYSGFREKFNDLTTGFNTKENSYKDTISQKDQEIQRVKLQNYELMMKGNSKSDSLDDDKQDNDGKVPDIDDIFDWKK